MANRQINLDHIIHRSHGWQDCFFLFTDCFLSCLCHRLAQDFRFDVVAMIDGFGMTLKCWSPEVCCAWTCHRVGLVNFFADGAKHLVPGIPQPLKLIQPHIAEGFRWFGLAWWMISFGFSLSGSHLFHDDDRLETTTADFGAFIMDTMHDSWAC